MARMAEEFMTTWHSTYFRERIVAQIEGAKEKSNPDPESEDQFEKFLAQNNSEQLEQFIYKQSQQKEDYLSLMADLLVGMRQCRGKPGQGRSQLKGEGEHCESVPNGEPTPNGDHTEESNGKPTPNGDHEAETAS